ncbi:unnamed protein product [Meganyctiphanes norvegica]|uniref:CD109 antigen n=1 Tax=Meganyctiphanes norvegica TaxID=48144 RepID=A0AAV2QXU9_MEGNR
MGTMIGGIAPHVLLFVLCCCYLSTVLGQDLGRSDNDPRGYAYGTDNRWRNVLDNYPRMRNRYNHPTHVILAPGIVRPASIYRVIVSILNLDHPVEVRASLQRDGLELTSEKKDIIKGYPEMLLLDVPQTVVDGDYRLRLEGNLPGTVGGTVFLNNTKLHFSTRFLTMLIQTNRPVYNGDQDVKFRIILLNTELKPYDDPVDVYVLDPDGYVMRRWPSRPTNVGVVSMSFRLPLLPKVGWWTIKALVGGQEELKRIKVEKWYSPRFEVKIFMPKYFLDTDEAITGSVQGEYGMDKGAYGNATLKLFVRNQELPTWAYVMEQNILELDGESEFEFPMSELAKRIPRLDGSEVRIEAEIHESFMSLNQTGFSHAKIINSSVNCRFIGSPPYVFKPGMPFQASVAVSYHDLQPLDLEKLGASKLIVIAEATSESGGRTTIMEKIIPQLNAQDNEQDFLAESEQYNKKLEDYQAYGDKWKPENFDYYYGADYESGSKFLTEEKLAQRKFQLFLDQQEFAEYREIGVYRFQIDEIPDKTVSIKLSATYQDDFGAHSATTANAIAYYSEKKKYIGIETSNKEVSVGEFGVFHVRSNFRMDSFHYLVMSKEMILYAGMEVVKDGASVKTLSLPISTEMAPAFKVVVYHVTQEREIITDVVTVPVDGISRHNVTLRINLDKDHNKRSVEFGTYATAGAFYGISGTRTFTWEVQGGNELSKSSVLAALHKFANNTRFIHKMTWRYREGKVPEKSAYYISGNYGPDANRTFEFNSLVIVTDAIVGTIPGYANNRCNATLGFSPCMTAGCYLTTQRCDGIKNCADGFDELECSDPLADKELNFRIHQFTHFGDMYDAEDGDWMWLDFNIGHKNHEQTTVEHGKVDDPYYITAFSVSKEYGFGLVPYAQEYSAMPPIYIAVEMPDACRRGEQVGIRVMVFNNLDIPHMILVVLHGSDDYKFLVVEEGGIIDRYKVRMESGDHQHLITVDAESAFEVLFPIVATVDQGIIEVTVSALTQVGSDEETVELEILPEGATIDRHTSVMLDLTNRAVVYEHMDIIVEESYIIPLQTRRRFVAGSPRGHVSVCGDVVGPTFPNGGPVDTVQMLRKELRGTEASVFNFGANLWTLHYLRLTNQLNLHDRADVFEQLNVELAAIMYRFREEEDEDEYSSGIERYNVWTGLGGYGGLNAGGGERPYELRWDLGTRTNTTYNRIKYSDEFFAPNLVEDNTRKDSDRLYPGNRWEQNLHSKDRLYGSDNRGGAFRNWDTAKPSVWLTAWTIRNLIHGQFQDWENILYIDSRVISKAVRWLIKWQTPTGAFMETPTYQEIPLDQKASAYSFSMRWRGARNITLTAQCLLALQETMGALQGEVRSQASNARISAMSYLERELDNIRDPYEVAIVAYVLSKANSGEKEKAFNNLDRLKTEQDGLVYWSRDPIKTNERVYENNQRNLLKPKMEQKWDSHAVEATSYALLVYLIRDGVDIIQERIVKWLNAMRMHDGGFISTVDTLVAMEALTEFSYRARNRDITGMKVNVEATGEEGRATNEIIIGANNVSHMNIVPITNVWGLVNINAHGTGQAILQLDVSWGIDWETMKKQPPVESFDLVITERYPRFGNRSVGNIEICARWVNTDEAPTSSATVIEIENPTGYVAYQLDLERSIYSAQVNKTFPSLKDVIGGNGDVHARKTVWFFDYIPGNESWCFKYKIRRWYPVANMTRIRMATIYEQHQPERFQMILVNHTLDFLDVCEACASYQCPYCPIYSHAGTHHQHALGTAALLLFLTVLYQKILVGSWSLGSGSNYMMMSSSRIDHRIH